MKGSNEQSAKSDYSYRAAKRQTRHDDDISQGKHSTPHFLSESVVLQSDFGKRAIGY